MQVVKRSQLCKLLSSDDFNRQQDVTMSITVTFSAIKSHTPDDNADDMSNSRHSPSLISISVGDDHPCCRRSHGFLRSLSLLVDSQSLCSYSIEQITVLHNY